MTPVPLTLPLRPSEANELANLVFELAERRPLTQEIRNRLASRIAALKFETLRPHLGSLVRDPVHHSTYYVALDVADGSPYLLHMALSTAPTSSIFQKPLLIGRMRRAAGQEIVINAVPFGHTDVELLQKFTSQVDDALLPKVQGTRAALVAPAVPAAFDAFRSILKRTGRNLAAIEMASSDFDAGLYTAVRAGWREGYSAGVVLSDETDRETIRSAARFTRFRVESPQPLPDKACEQQFEALFNAEDRGWIFDEFVRSIDAAGAAYEFAAEDVARLAVRFAPPLRTSERLHEWIRQERAAVKAAKGFDFEAVLPAASPRELLFCLHWLKTRGHAPQLVAPYAIPDEAFEDTIRQMAAIARHYSCQLVFDTAGNSPARLETIARAAAGRVNFRATALPPNDSEFSHDLIGIAELLIG